MGEHSHISMDFDNVSSLNLPMPLVQIKDNTLAQIKDKTLN